MNIKKPLLTYLSFGEKLKIKNSEDYSFDAMSKLTFGASAVKSSLANKDLKSTLLTALINTLPFAVLSVIILAVIYAIGGSVLNIVNHFSAGIICYFIFVLIELFKSNYNHFKTHNILKPSLIIAGATFLLSCATVIREIYHIITKGYLEGKLFDFSAITIIFTVVFIAVLTMGEFKKNLNTLLAVGVSVLYLASNVSYFKTISFMAYIRLALVLIMLGLMVYTVAKENKGIKLNLKAPLIILGVTALIVLAISLVTYFAFGEIKKLKKIIF